MPSNTNNPVNGQPAQQATGARINDLQPIADQDISLSMNFEVDLPNETFRASWQQLVNYIKQDIFNATHGVGSIIFRTDGQTPQSLGLPGIWERQEADISVRSGLADNSDLGTISGNNTPTVPVPLHSHNSGSLTNGAHGHTGTISEAGRHSHVIDLADAGSGNTPMSGTSNNKTTMSQESGDHTHTLTINNGGATAVTGQTAPTGVDGATLNVTGRHLNGVIWVRTA